MAQIKVTKKISKMPYKVTTEKVVKELNQLPPEYLPDVLKFIQFLEYKFIDDSDHSEDEALWDAVQANQAYKAKYPNEEFEQYSSGTEFLKAVADL